MNSYHDVHVVVNGVHYHLASDPALKLTCEQAAGWQLWRTDLHSYLKIDTLIGGEFNHDDFTLFIGEAVVFNKRRADTIQISMNNPPETL